MNVHKLTSTFGVKEPIKRGFLIDSANQLEKPKSNGEPISTKFGVLTSRRSLWPEQVKIGKTVNSRGVGFIWKSKLSRLGVLFLGGAMESNKK